MLKERKHILRKQPLFDLDTPIPLRETEMTIKDSKLNIFKLSANVFMKLNPRPKVYIECHKLKNKENKDLEFNMPTVIEGTVFNTTTDFMVEIDSHILLLTPRYNPTTIQHREENLSSVEFAVLNFPDLGKNRLVCINNQILTETYFELKSDIWTINIESTYNSYDTQQSIRKDIKYSITHTGIIQRIDGADFSLECVNQLLFCIQKFLSFVRGHACGITLIKGRNRNDELVFEKWGVEQSNTEPGIPPTGNWSHSIINPQYQYIDTFTQAFSGFWELYQSEGAPLRTIIDLYIISKKQGIPEDIRIILNQMSLEHLASIQYPTESQISPYHISCSLKENNVTTEIPENSCPALEKFIKNDIDRIKGVIDEIEKKVNQSREDGKELKKKKRIKAIYENRNGISLLTQIRNDCTHSRKELGEIPLEALMEATRLGHFYIEQMLLQLSKYNGYYYNIYNILEDKTSALPRKELDHKQNS